MKFNNSIPIYIQVIDKFKEDLVTGKVKLGDKLPSTRDLAVELGINPNTASRIYKEMETLGLCYKKRGLGTFITESQEVANNIRTEMADKLIVNFIDGMKKLGYTSEDMAEIVIKYSNEE